MKATENPQMNGFYLDKRDDHVDLVLSAAAKSLSELYQGSYDVRDLDDGFVGIRVHLSLEQVEKIAGYCRTGDRSIKRLIVDFETGRFSFERREHENKTSSNDRGMK